MNNSLVSILLFIAAAISMPSVFAAPVTIPLWPQQAPGEKGDIGEEKSATSHDGAPVTRVTDVTKPTLTVFPAPADKNSGAAVIVCPGGGYHHLCMDKEGSEICEWLNSIGVTGILLKYRVPARKGLEKHVAPLQDAQRALGIVRHRAAEWHLDPKRIGILGFSAGGHLAAVASNTFEKRTYEPLDESDQISCRPDFAVLIYPAYLVAKSTGVDGKLSPELTVTANTPPTFLVQTEDDSVRVECGLGYYLALKNAKVPVEMHLYPVGGHGYGMRPSDKTVSTWPKRAGDWLRASGLLETK